VGGKQLSSTGQTSSYPDGKPKMYPPAAAEDKTASSSAGDADTPTSAAAATDSKSATEATGTTATTDSAAATEGAADEPEPQPVGE